MRTFHVVGIDFQLRLGRDTGRFAQQDVAALLPGIGALGIGSHIDHSAELAHGTASGDTLDIGITAAVGNIVRRVQFQHTVLLACGKEDASQFVFGIRTVEIDPIRRVGARQLHRRQAAATVRSLRHVHLGKCLCRE